MKSVYTQSLSSLLVALALLLAGCASTVTTDKQASANEPAQRKLAQKYKVVGVDVLSDGKASEIVDQLSLAIVSKLREKNAFERVLLKSATLQKSFDISVSVMPKNYENRDTAQALVGILGGQSAIQLQVALVDEASGKTFAIGTIEAKAPTKVTLFSSSSMALAIDLVAEEVAKFVLANT